MLNVLRRSCGRHPPSLSRSYAELVPVNSTRTSAPPPLKGSIDPPTPNAIAGPNDSASSAESQLVSPARLGNRIPVREDHGLYAFFRKKQPAQGQTLEGEAQYETLGGSRLVERFQSGRSWKASELRLKSFEDLHTLWYILLRERNLLATQQEECRKSMARIKYVMNERRLAYEGAVKLAEEEKKSHITDLVLKQQLAEHQQEREQLVKRQGEARLKAAEAKEVAEAVLEDKVGDDLESADIAEEVTTAGEEVEQVAESDIGNDVKEAEIKAKAEETPSTPNVAPRKSNQESASEAATAGLFGRTRGRRR
ncbi:hypothetical protein BT96DRAFT_923105 [Gymnopus androsaceus JB14]|uniref:Large ribosomal subunit protein uL29m n=1 Tax=Gymnopus androsaceus JB14 TaxID=1447944 RepID=A0A6A4HBF9_9AGAR|nr:hypothetical protein BT96DRAFT_923105 [Gymnopus androsaceus JB14]